jgi:hypothetical protein
VTLLTGVQNHVDDRAFRPSDVGQVKHGVLEAGLPWESRWMNSRSEVSTLANPHRWARSAVAMTVWHAYVEALRQIGSQTH